MEITNNNRIIVYRNSKPVQKTLYGNLEYGYKLINIAKENNLSEEILLDKFIILVGDIVLGFYKIEDTVPLLQQELGLDAKTAALLGADVLDFLAPLSDPNFVVPIDEDAAVEMPVQSVTEILPEPNLNQDSMSSAIPTTSPYIPSVATRAEMHTMASDAAIVRPEYQPFTQTAETTHVSRQPALSDLPSYAKPAAPASASKPTPTIETPRWGT